MAATDREESDEDREKEFQRQADLTMVEEAFTALAMKVCENAVVDATPLRQLAMSLDAITETKLAVLDSLSHYPFYRSSSNPFQK